MQHLRTLIKGCIELENQLRPLYNQYGYQWFLAPDIIKHNSDLNYKYHICRRAFYVYCESLKHELNSFKDL